MSTHSLSQSQEESRELETIGLERLLARNTRAQPQEHASSSLPSVFTGKVIALTANRPMIDFVGNPSGEPVAARAICAVTAQHIGSDVVLVFENNDPLKPIVLGIIQPAPAENTNESDPAPIDVVLDGEQVTLTAKKELVLRCGKASITLTRAGKVLIRGAYLLSRSSGANRIKGGSVQIN